MFPGFQDFNIKRMDKASCQQCGRKYIKQAVMSEKVCGEINTKNSRTKQKNGTGEKKNLTGRIVSAISEYGKESQQTSGYNNEIDNQLR